MSVHLILNPAAKSGKIQKKIPELKQMMEAHFPGNWSLHLTQKPGDASKITQETIQRGAELIIAAGGDGTVHEVVNGFFEEGILINPNCALGILNFGTGHDFARTLKLPKTLKDQFAWLKGPSKRIDIGRVKFHDHNGQAQMAYFINECQAGLGGVVAQKVGKGHKKLGGKLAFGLVSLQQALLKKASPIEVGINGQAPRQEKVLALVTANGAFMGAGMKTTPQASIQDGLFDILFIKKMNLLQRVINFSKIYTGSHLQSRFVQLERGHSVELESNESVPIEADGEFLGFLPCIMEIVAEKIPIKSA